jgi:hypothetical protein
MSISIILVLATAMNSTTHIELSCPEYVETVQQALAVPGGWQTSQDHSMSESGRLPRTTMGFSDGPPQERATLAPSGSSRKASGIRVNHWSLQRSEAVWFVCSYNQTTIQLSKPLPAGLGKCFIEVHPVKGPTRAWCE